MSRSEAIKRGLRPCIVKVDKRSEIKAYFHKWVDYSKPVEASLLKGGAPAGVISFTLAIVENAYTGVVFECIPENITFLEDEI